MAAMMFVLISCVWFPPKTNNSTAEKETLASEHFEVYLGSSSTPDDVYTDGQRRWQNCVEVSKESDTPLHSDTYWPLLLLSHIDDVNCKQSYLLYQGINNYD